MVCTGAAADVEVRFFDDGSLIVGAHVSVLMENPTPSAIKLAPSPDGTYIVGAEIGSKITLQVQSPTQQYIPVTVSVLADVIDVDVVTRQTNDLCADAIPVAVPSVTAGTTIGATQGPEPLCGTSNTAPGVWYSVMGTGNTMTASTCNDGNPDTGSADYDSKLMIWCKGCDELQCVGGNDDGPGCLGFSSSISWCSEVTEYLILVQGFFGDIGNFELAVFDNGVACSGAVPCLPPPPTGACCNCLPAPFNCTEGTVDECMAFDGQFQGDGTTCLVIDNQSSPDLAIPDGAGIFVCDTIDVADSLIINDVNVAMTFTHTWIGDLEVSVEHNSTLLTLWLRQCGSTDNINSTADDEYNSISCADIAGGPLFDVRWPPAIGGLGPLSVYDGMDAVGPWTLCAADFVGLDSGTMDFWALQFNDELFPTICEDQGELVGFCHCPPGHNVYDETGACIDNNRCRTIDIADAAIPAHLANHSCDYLGACLDGADTDANVVDTVFAPVDETNSVFGD
jgi:subtilisin-like proprotein convertase family protein